MNQNNFRFDPCPSGRARPDPGAFRVDGEPVERGPASRAFAPEEGRALRHLRLSRTVAQVRQALRNIDATLREFGGTLDNIVRTATYAVDRVNLDGARAGRKALMDEGLTTDKPANTLLVIAGLADEDRLVEIESIAVLD